MAGTHAVMRGYIEQINELTARPVTELSWATNRSA